MTKVPRQGRFTRRISILFAIAVLLIAQTVIGGVTSAQDEPAIPVVNSGEVEPAESPAEVKPKPAVNPKKVIKATILFAALGGIAVFGVGAIAATMLWAKHLRRVARDPGPPQRTVGNDFWFLKPPKPSITESELSESHRPPHSPPETEASE